MFSNGGYVLCVRINNIVRCGVEHVTWKLSKNKYDSKTGTGELKATSFVRSTTPGISLPSYGGPSLLPFPNQYLFRTR